MLIVRDKLLKSKISRSSFGRWSNFCNSPIVNVENEGLRRVIPWDISVNVTVEVFVDVGGAVVDIGAGAFVSGSISSSDGNWRKKVWK